MENVQQQELESIGNNNEPLGPNEQVAVKTEDKNYFKSKYDQAHTFFLSKLLKPSGKIYRFLITNNFGKCLVGIVFFFYLSFSIYQASRIEEGLEIANLVADKSYFRSFVKENFAEFNLEAPIVLAICEPVDYSNKSVRNQINQLLDEARELEGMNNNFLLNWMNIFNDELKELRKSHNPDLILQKMTETTSSYSNDIILGFNEALNQTQIFASRFYLKYEKTTLTSKDAVVMNRLRALCANSDLPIEVYSVGFKMFEQFEQTVPNILQAFIIATESMYLITLIFIPDLVSAICIILSMGSIMIGMIGFMHVWGLSLSSITMIEVIMSVGFCIDFSAHLTHSFIAGVGKGSRNERAYQACLQTGVPILNSALSTIIGVCVLGFSESYIFMTFFKTLLIVMLLGVLTSMLFLPVLLSLIGPHWKIHKELICNKVENVVVTINEK